MNKENIKVVLTQPSDYKVSSSSYRQSIIRSPPIGIRGGGGSYFHLLYGCLAGEPSNKEEIVAFLAHVAHETDGLKTLKEYHEENGTTENYQNNSWSEIKPYGDKLYYGRGWLQLSYPANYYAAGNALSVDLWRNPDQVANDEVLACKTAIWFWKENGMGHLSQQGLFNETTRILNPSEFTSDHAKNLEGRNGHYERVRKIYGL